MSWLYLLRLLHVLQAASSSQKPQQSLCPVAPAMHLPSCGLHALSDPTSVSTLPEQGLSSCCSPVCKPTRAPGTQQVFQK